MPASKKKVIKSLDSLGEDLLALIKKQYPNGYESSLTRINTPKKEAIFVFPLETEEATYLVKVPATKNSDGEYDVHTRKEKEEFELPRAGAEDDIESESDEMDEDDDYDDEDGVRSRRKDPSYDPDFDN